MQHHWLDRLAWSGFAEYPGGAYGAVDADSGPIVDGLGVAATVLGLAATRSVADQGRWNRLRGQADIAAHLMPELIAYGAASGISGLPELSTDYLTGFLIGDAVLFWASNWTYLNERAGD